MSSLVRPTTLPAASSRKTILVTGAIGYIGSHTALCCLLSGEYRVVTIDNFSNSSPLAAARITELAIAALPATATAADRADCTLQVYEGDITSPVDLQSIFDDYAQVGGIWGVIHLAALKAVGDSALFPLAYYSCNVAATVNLLETMERNSCFRIVYSSSATVYGEPSIIPIPESSPLAPESVYGRTKMMCELILLDACSSPSSKFSAISLRYFNPAGAHPSGRIGEDPKGKPGNLLPLLAQMAVGKYAGELKIFGNDYSTEDGTCVRDYIHVMDLAQGHVLALSALDRDSTFAPSPSSSSTTDAAKDLVRYKAYNLGKGKGMSVLQMVKAMKDASGFDYVYEIIGRRIGDVPNLTADPSAAERELGFKAPRVLLEMCRDQWNWQSQNPRGYE